MKTRMIKIFICLEAALYLAFTSMDIYALGSSAPLKFAGIALCFAFSLFLSACGGERLVTAAVGIAMTADIFLLLLDAHYAVGMGLFFLVQILYFARIYRANGHKSAWPTRVFLFTGCFSLFMSLGGVDVLTALAAAVYFSFFLCNVMQASGSENRLFFAGLCVFLCCDICVGLYNMPEQLPAWLHRAAGIGMWTFYLPSQVMLVLSGRERDMYEKQE